MASTTTLEQQLETWEYSPHLETVEVQPTLYIRWKLWPGRLLALVGLILTFPLLLVLVALARLTSPGPGIYRQVRVGANGRRFVIYKIRTMRQDAEAQTGPAWSAHGDDRMTRVGRVLRACHLDELPQLINVVKGEMAVVGPRPERPEFTKLLTRAIPQYSKRLLATPGITGLAQINLPADTDLESVCRKLEVDLDYIQHASPWLDFRILLCTCLRMVGFRGFSTSRWLGLQRLPARSPRGGIRRETRFDDIEPEFASATQNPRQPR